MIDGDQLTSPSVGTFTPATVAGGPLAPGALLGTLMRAGRAYEVRIPDGVAGAAVELLAAGSWVQCGTALCRVGEGSQGMHLATAAAATDVPDGHTGVRADTDGTVYLRPEPTAGPFVSEGQTVKAGTTLALVEVMKTFTPVRAPIDGTLTEVRVSDNGSVAADQVMFVLRG